MKPLRCMLGLHAGQAQGGTMMFMCPGCHGWFWPPKDYRHVTAAADRLIDQGKVEEALQMARRAVEEGEQGGLRRTFKGKD